MSHLVQKLFAIHDSLTNAGLRHGFGGAIALAYCIEEPRGTRDLDLNIFVPPSRAELALQALPAAIESLPEDVRFAERDGQTRVWWDGTPIDVFFSTLPLHELMPGRLMWVPLAGRTVPVIDCASLVVFKALVDRKKDWADIEAVAECSSAAIEAAADAFAELVPDNDPRCGQLKALVGEDARNRLRAMREIGEMRSIPRLGG
jgi:hypothetical protein